MSFEWKRMKIGDLCDQFGAELQTGPFGSQLHSYDYKETGIPVVPTEAIDDGKINPDVLPRISSEKANELSRHLLRQGDILFARRGAQATGKTAIVRKSDEGAICGTGAIRLRIEKAKSIAFPSFLATYLSGKETICWIRHHAIGATMPNLNEGIIRSIPILLPSLQEQKAIVHILGTLDDKIELNSKINETLEAMAKALFKSWFVDFDPVRAKVEGRSTGLPAEISDLFPDSFEDSELGEIPRGWSVGEIQDIAELNPETWGSRNQPLRVKYLDLSNVKYGKIDCIEEYEWGDAPSRARRVLKTGDTVVGTVRPGNGSYCLIGEDGITGSTGFAVLRPKNKNDNAFVYLSSCSRENIDRLAHLADGGAYPAVRPELVAQTPVIVVRREVLDCFSNRISPLFTAAEKRKQFSKVLCRVRDALLPKLISGEIRIPDAEKMLEEVGV